MVRKKSSASKAKTRRDAHRRQLITLRNSRPWGILLLVMQAVRIFLCSRHNAAIAARLPPSWGAQGDDFIPQNSISAVCDDVSVIFPNMTDSREQFDDFIVVRQVKKIRAEFVKEIGLQISIIPMNLFAEKRL